MNTLLPPNTSRTERNLATVGANAQALPILFRSLWSPLDPALPLLPHLAASWRSTAGMTSGLRPPSARSSPTARRSCTVAGGTIGAIRRVGTLGYLIRVLLAAETPAATLVPSSSTLACSIPASPKPCTRSWSG